MAVNFISMISIMFVIQQKIYAVTISVDHALYATTAIGVTAMIILSNQLYVGIFI